MRGKIVYIDLPPLLKGEVLLHKSSILEELDRAGKKGVDIR